MNYLIVVAHPDDEVLGAGGTVYRLSRENNVYVCVMSAQANARAHRPGDNELSEDIGTSSRILGIKEMYMGDFPNIKMNTCAHLELVQFIEKAIIASKADVVITHHPADPNNDHMHTSMACQEAVRLFQRRNDVTPLAEFWYMEVLSSSEWALNTAMNRFVPNTFVEIGADGVRAKTDALGAYRGVMREYPHPRSEKAIEGLAAYRGAQAGCVYAEAYECVFRRMAQR